MNDLLKELKKQQQQEQTSDSLKESLEKLEEKQQLKQKELLKNIKEIPKKEQSLIPLDTNKELSDCTTQLLNIKNNNPYRNALIQLGRMDKIADIELSNLSKDDLLKKYNKTSDEKFQELILSKLVNINKETELINLTKFQNNKVELKKNKEAFDNIKKDDKLPINLKNLFSKTEEQLKKDFHAIFPNILSSYISQIKFIKDENLKQNTYRALFYLLPNEFQGTNITKNNEHKLDLYKKIIENKKSSFGVNNMSWGTGMYGAMYPPDMGGPFGSTLEPLPYKNPLSSKSTPYVISDSTPYIGNGAAMVPNYPFRFGSRQTTPGGIGTISTKFSIGRRNKKKRNRKSKRKSPKRKKKSK